MKKHKYIVLGIFLILISIPAITFAVSKRTRPFGGMILSTPTDLSAAITCTAGYGPFIIRPVSVHPAGPYFIQFPKKGLPKRLGWIIGNYNLVPDTKTCFNPETGAPVPAFEVTLYGVSR